MGAIGLLAFALIVWRYLPGNSPYLILPVAGAAWFAVSVFLWLIRKSV